MNEVTEDSTAQQLYKFLHNDLTCIHFEIITKISLDIKFKE